MYSSDTELSAAIRDTVKDLPGTAQLAVSSIYDPRYGGKVLLGPADIEQLRRAEAALGVQREELGITDMDIEPGNDGSSGELYLAVVVELYRHGQVPRQRKKQR
jgi:hypothetical protein